MLAVFFKALRDSRRTILWLSIGLGLYALLILSFYPSILENREQFDELLQNYPEELLAFMLGGVDITEFSFADPAGFYQIYFGTWMVLALGVMVTMQAFNAVTNPERNGTMDVMMSFPVSRQRMLLGRFLNTMVSLAVVLLVCFLLFLVGTIVIEGLDLGFVDLFLAMVGAFLLLMVQAMLTYMLAALVPSSRRWVGAAAYGLFFGAYLVYGLSGLSDLVDTIKPVLLFNYYDASLIIRNGVDIVDWLVMGGAALVFAGVALWGIERKQLAV